MGRRAGKSNDPVPLGKLLEIRRFVVSQKQLILQMYAYLRDAQIKEFYHESMAGALPLGAYWEH
jgi:hypothetical protein